MTRTSLKSNSCIKIFVVLMALGFCLLFSSSSLAAKPDYGFWYGSEQGDLKSYDSGSNGFNDDQSTESLNLSCITEDGKVIGDEQRKWLNDIFVAGAQVYNGEFNIKEDVGSESEPFFIEDEGKLEDAEKDRNVPEDKRSFTNGGYSEGIEGYQAFIRNEKRLLQQNIWVPYEHREVKGDGQDSDSSGGKTYTLPNGTIVFISEGAIKGDTIKGKDSGSDALNIVGLGGEEVDTPLIKKRRLLASLIETDAKNQLQSSMALPRGCILNEVNISFPSGINELSADPVGFVGGVFAGAASKIVNPIYKMVSETAWQWTFWTPHSERGDLIWNTPANCTAGNSSPFILQKNIAQYCSGNKALGFNKTNLRPSDNKAAYVSVSHFIQWMISGIYFIIIFLSIVIFIVRGNKARILNMMQTIPRLLLSIILTLFSAFIIGAVISFANMLVLAIFGSGSAYDVGAVNAMLTAPDQVVGGMSIGDFGSPGDIFNLIIWVIVTFCFVVFTIGALVRQIALVVLVVTAPIAFFCLINPNWQQYLYKWVRTLLVVSFLPVILAFLLKISMSINPVVISAAESYGDSKLGLLSIFMMVLTLWLMSKIVRSSKNFITGQSGMATGAMGAAGGWLSKKGEASGKWNPAGMLARRAGGNMTTSASNAEGLAAMVPSNKILGGGGASLAAAGGGGAMGGARALMGGSIGPQHVQGRVGAKISKWSAARKVAQDYGQGSLDLITPQEFAKHQQYISARAKELVDNNSDLNQAQAKGLAAEEVNQSLGGTLRNIRGKHFIERDGAGVQDAWEKENDFEKYKQTQRSRAAQSAHAAQLAASEAPRFDDQGAPTNSAGHQEEVDKARNNAGRWGPQEEMFDPDAVNPQSSPVPEDHDARNQERDQSRDQDRDTGRDQDRDQSRDRQRDEARDRARDQDQRQEQNRDQRNTPPQPSPQPQPTPQPALAPEPAPIVEPEPVREQMDLFPEKNSDFSPNKDKRL